MPLPRLKKYGKNISTAIKDGDITAMNLLEEHKLMDYYNRVQKMNQRAANLSKLYMVATQTEGVYDSFKEAKNLIAKLENDLEKLDIKFEKVVQANRSKSSTRRHF